MATAKVSMLFNTLIGPPAGWGEEYYLSTLQNPTDFSAGVATSLIPAARTDLLTPDYYMYAIRTTIYGDTTTNPPTPNQVFLRPFGTTLGKGTFPTAQNAGNSAPPWVALKISMAYPIGKTRAYHLHGLPINVVSNTYAYTIGTNPAFDVRLNRYQQLISGVGTGDAYSPMSKNRVFYSPAVAPNTLSVSTDLRSLIVLLNAQTVPPLFVGDLLQVHYVPLVDWVNKTWRVINVTPITVGGVTTYSIVCHPHKQQVIGLTAPLIGVGQIRKVIYGLQRCTYARAVEGVERKVGLPFDRPRGRRGVIHG